MTPNRAPVPILDGEMDRPGWVFSGGAEVLRAADRFTSLRRVAAAARPWWEATFFFAAVILAIWGFVSIVGLDTRFLSRRTDRTAKDMYDEFADSPGKQREYARRHGGESRNE